MSSCSGALVLVLGGFPLFSCYKWWLHVCVGGHGSVRPIVSISALRAMKLDALIWKGAGGSRYEEMKDYLRSVELILPPTASINKKYPIIPAGTWQIIGSHRAEGERGGSDASGEAGIGSLNSSKMKADIGDEGIIPDKAPCLMLQGEQEERSLVSAGRDALCKVIVRNYQ